MALATAPAMADVKAGVDAWSRGDFPTAVGAWQGPAAQGDADAQFNLGQAYRLGRGVEADLAKAEELFGKAAAQGHIHASDYYGLLLFQRGERAKALPFVSAAADRGEPRAQYLLGIANFNGDNVPKDWVRAYALVSLAQQAGLQQATSTLSQMDQFIPLDQRQKSVALAQELSAQADSTRARQMAAAELGNSVPGEPSAPVVTAVARAPVAIASCATSSASIPPISSRLCSATLRDPASRWSSLLRSAAERASRWDYPLLLRSPPKPRWYRFPAAPNAGRCQNVRSADRPATEAWCA